MLFFAVVIFVVAFSVTALLIVAATTGEDRRRKANLSRLQSTVVNREHVDEMPIDIRKQEGFSSIPWLNALLVRLDFITNLRELLHQADVAWTPVAFLARCVFCWLMASIILYLWRAVAIPALLFGLIAAGFPLAYVLGKRSKKIKQFEQQLPPALDMMVSALRAGHSLVSSLDLVGRESPDPLGQEFRICFEEQNYGLDLRIALEHMAERVPLADIKIMVTAILIQRESGGNLAEVLDKCAHVMRERFRLQREIRVRTAQGRLTGWILSFLPPALGILLFFIYPEEMRLLWTRPLGQKLLVVSAIMTLIGAYIIRKIVRIEV